MAVAGGDRNVVFGVVGEILVASLRSAGGFFEMPFLLSGIEDPQAGRHVWAAGGIVGFPAAEQGDVVERIVGNAAAIIPLGTSGRTNAFPLPCLRVEEPGLNFRQVFLGSAARPWPRGADEQGTAFLGQIR